MTRLKLSDITDGKPVKLTIEIPARLHRRLIEYGCSMAGYQRVRLCLSCLFRR